MAIPVKKVTGVLAESLIIEQHIHLPDIEELLFAGIYVDSAYRGFERFVPSLDPLIFLFEPNKKPSVGCPGNSNPAMVREGGKVVFHTASGSYT